MREGYPQFGDDIRCACVADRASIEVVGGAQYAASFSGEMRVTAGEAFEDEGGRAIVPLAITGHATAGQADGLGRLTVDRDEEREVGPSTLTEIEPGTGFPAVQEMHVNILVTVPDLLPGVTLRNVDTGVLRNERQAGFPPENATYELQRPLDLERVDQPGTIVARILNYSARINPSAESEQ